MCQGEVKIEGVCYSVIVFQDAGAQLSVCRNVTGMTISTGRYVLCLGMNAVDVYGCVHVKLDCPNVTVAAQVAVAEVLPVKGVDFLISCWEMTWRE